MKFVVRDDIYSKKTDDVWLVLDQSKSAYFELNEVAGEIWEELQTPVTLEKIAHKIATLYKVDYVSALQDVQEFVQTHLKGKLLQQVK